MLRRYTASADATIVSAYELNMSTRGTGSNTGEADILETFSIYGRQSTSSQELSRILIKFPIDEISSDRTAGKVPASGSVSFYLKMFNAPHSKTVPKNYKLIVRPVSASWQEGDGLDLEGYKDVTYDESGTNWINANSNSTAATATVTVLNEGFIENGDTITLTAADGTEVVCTMHATTTTSTAQTTAVQAARNGGSTTAVASEIATAINFSSFFSATAASNVVTITQATAGLAGNTTVTIVEGGATGFSKTNFTGGDGKWNNVGGDYLNTPIYSQSFDSGTENLEIDISELVENWITGAPTKFANYGVGVFMSSSYEASASQSSVDSDSNVILNTTGSGKSYYTKRFFARGTQYFYHRPVIEARWDSSTLDDRGYFFFSSSRAPAADNLNTLYFYNMIRGRLVDLPGITPLYGSPFSKIMVSLFSGSSSGSAPAGAALTLSNSDLGTSKTSATGGWVSTGIYSCSICLASSSITSLYDVWFSGSQTVANASSATKQYFTGSIKPKVFDTGISTIKNPYRLSITNLQPKYLPNDTARLNVYIRRKNWSPTVYTVATQAVEVETIVSASYRVYRVVDGFTVVAHGTGSDNHTRLSYDVSGNYFDLDMRLLQPGYAYGLKFAFYDERNLAWQEQEETFKFRVMEYEY